MADTASLLGNFAAAMAFGADAGLLDVTKNGARDIDYLAAAAALVASF